MRHNRLKLSCSVIFLLGATFARNLAAYPQYIGFGYASCLTCHYNAAGNGPLTDYGRALAATEAAGHVFIKATDEQLAKASGFLGPFGTLPPWFRAQANYRGIEIVSGLEGRANTRWINMQGSVNGILQFMDEKLVAVGDIGYAPTYPNPTPGTSNSHLISREYYVSYRPMKAFSAYVGLQDIAFGLRVPNHTAYIRSNTGLNERDQVHGIMLHSGSDKYDAFLHGFVGNLNQDASLRQKGVSAEYEYSVAENLRLGASVLFSSSDFLSRQMGAVHTRIGLGGGSAVLAEVGLVNWSPANQGASLRDVFFLQTQTRLVKGLYLLMNFEQYAGDLTTGGARQYRVGPTIDYMPFQRLELRVDLRGTRTTGGALLDRDAITLLSQVHVWL